MPIDIIRKIIWINDNVDWWYAQNLLLFVNNNAINDNNKIKHEYEKRDMTILPLVHPKNYLIKAYCDISGLRHASTLIAKILCSLPKLTKNSLKRIIRNYLA